ncbi:MAG: hypothetical protein R3F60_32370 [bacterium]
MLDRLAAQAGEALYLTLLNTRTRLVASGRPAGLAALQAALAADPRKTTWEWLAVGGPFHSPLMAAGRAAMAATLAAEGIRFDAGALALPLLDPADGRRLNDAADPRRCPAGLPVHAAGALGGDRPGAGGAGARRRRLRPRLVAPATAWPSPPWACGARASPSSPSPPPRAARPSSRPAPRRPRRLAVTTSPRA